MLPLLAQVQLATDTATTWMSRLTGAQMKEWEHSETTLDEVRARIRRTIDYLRSIVPGVDQWFRGPRDRAPASFR